LPEQTPLVEWKKKRVEKKKEKRPWIKLPTDASIYQPVQRLLITRGINGLLFRIKIKPESDLMRSSIIGLEGSKIDVITVE